MRAVLIATLLSCCLPALVNGQARGGGACMGAPYIGGYVMLPEESQQKARGIEVRLMYGAGNSTAFGISTGVSVMTEANGRFTFNESIISIMKNSRNELPPLFLYVNIEGLSPIFQPANACSSGNILMLKRGATDDLDRTYREPIPLTRVEALRAELVKQYNELAVREYEQALRDILNKKNDNAIGHLNKAIKAAPEFVDAYMQLGILQYQSQRLEEAEPAFRRAVSLKPSASGPLTELGRLLIDKAKGFEQAGEADKANATYTEAADQLKKAVGAAPWITEAYYYLGSALYKLNQLAEAESALQSALVGDQPWQDGRLMLVNVYIKLRRYAEALTQLKAFIDAVPDSPQRGAAEKLQAQIQEALKQPQ